MPRWRPLPEELDPQIHEFTSQLRRLVDRSGLSVAAIADRTGYSKSSWERYLNGRLLPPRGATQALAEVTETDVRHLGTMWELAERAWSRSEMRHDVTMEAVRVAQARAALGEFGEGPAKSKKRGRRKGPGRTPEGEAEPIPESSISPSAPPESPTPQSQGPQSPAPQSPAPESSVPEPRRASTADAGGRAQQAGSAERDAGDRASAQSQAHPPTQAPSQESSPPPGQAPETRKGPETRKAPGTRKAPDTRTAPLRPQARPQERNPASGWPDAGSTPGTGQRVDVTSWGAADRGARTGPAREAAPGTAEPGTPGAAPGSGAGQRKPAQHRAGGARTGQAGAGAAAGAAAAGAPASGPAAASGAGAGAAPAEAARREPAGHRATGSAGPGGPGGTGPGSPGDEAGKRRVTMFLAGIVGALVLIAAAVLLFDLTSGGGDTAKPKPSADAGNQKLPAGVKCRGGDCTGKDPENMGCGGQHAKTSSSSWVGASYVEVRYSKVCQAAWARVTGGTQGDSLKVTAAKRTERDSVDATSDAYTKMVSAKSADAARACVTLTAGGSGCTTPGTTSPTTRPEGQ